MRKSFGTLKGIPVYKVERFDPDLAKRGYIQLVDDGDRFWKICTTSSVADGMYDSAIGNTSLYDEENFNMNLKMLERMAECRAEEKSKPTPKAEPKKNLTEECVNCLLPELDGIINCIMGSVNAACEDLMSRVEAVG
jgi:hypothetical protein